MTVDEVRQAINEWSQDGLFRIRGLGEQIALKTIASHSCYTLRLKTEYENRRVSAAQVPYKGGPVDSEGEAPGPWVIPVCRPDHFEERQENITVPHTEQIVKCSTCSGTGEVTCAACGGVGRTISYDYQYFEPCRLCANGQLVCDKCTGSGRVKSFNQLTVRIEVATAKEALSTANVLGIRMFYAEGQTVIDQRLTSGEEPAGLPLEVAGRVAELLRHAHAAGGAEKCVLFQHLQVEEVPVCEVVYEYRGPPERLLWIYGQQRFVYAPGAPRPWGKIALVCGGLLLAAVGAAWAVWAVMVPK
jgi:hypothetical protein